MSGIAWTTREVEWLTANAWGKTESALAVELTSLFGTKRTKASVHNYCFKHGIKTGNACGFQPGNEYGIKPNPIGHERIEGGYTLVKTSENKRRGNYEKKQRVVYRKHYGDIPNGCHIIFLDNDKTNFAPNNLRCIENRVKRLMQSNRWWSSNPVMTELKIRWCEHYYAIKDAENTI